MLWGGAWLFVTLPAGGLPPCPPAPTSAGAGAPSRPACPARVPPTGATVLVPHVPGMLTDYFAGRRVGHAVLCGSLPPDAPAADAAACQNAHSDVVTWSSWTAFLSNSIVSLLLVRRWCRGEGG